MFTIVQWQDISKISLNELLQKSTYTLLYFYPKDNTPGCTKEAVDFTNLQDDFSDLDIQIVGVSKDSENSHCKFTDKHNLSIPLISDPELTLHKQFGARWEKNNYGKIVQWVIRSTFLLDKNWQIVKERTNVRATWHAERVLKEVQWLDLL